MINTKLTPKQLMKLNPSIKTNKQATKILRDIKTKPSVSLEAINKHFTSVWNKGARELMRDLYKKETK